VGRLYTREKYLGIKENAYELFYNTLAFLSGKFKSLRKRSINLSFSTEVIKKINRGEREFKAPGKKSERKSGISPEPNSSIISSISNFKIF
jgi:hypothetical protein